MKINWGYSIIIFFVVFCSLMIAFLVFSLSQNSDLVTDDYYEKGANFTHQMEINSRSASYNDSILLRDQNGTLVARFAKSINQMSDSMNIYFYRPSNKKLDYKVVARLASDSISFDKKSLVNGHYTLTFEWSHEKKRYQVVKDFFNQ